MHQQWLRRVQLTKGVFIFVKSIFCSLLLRYNKRLVANPFIREKSSSGKRWTTQPDARYRVSGIDDEVTCDEVQVSPGSKLCTCITSLIDKHHYHHHLFPRCSESAHLWLFETTAYRLQLILPEIDSGSSWWHAGRKLKRKKNRKFKELILTHR